MDPIRLKTEVPTDLEGVRALLLKMAPMFESRSPGITGSLEAFPMDQPLQLQNKAGEFTTVRFERLATGTAIKVEVQPPTRALGKLRARWWSFRTRWLVKIALKRAKLEVERTHPKARVDAQGVVTPEIMPGD